MWGLKQKVQMFNLEMLQEVAEIEDVIIRPTKAGNQSPGPEEGELQKQKVDSCQHTKSDKYPEIIQLGHYL